MIRCCECYYYLLAENTFENLGKVKLLLLGAAVKLSSSTFAAFFCLIPHLSVVLSSPLPLVPLPLFTMNGTERRQTVIICYLCFPPLPPSTLRLSNFSGLCVLFPSRCSFPLPSASWPSAAAMLPVSSASYPVVATQSLWHTRARVTLLTDNITP